MHNYCLKLSRVNILLMIPTLLTGFHLFIILVMIAFVIFSLLAASGRLDHWTKRVISGGRHEEAVGFKHCFNLLVLQAYPATCLKNVYSAAGP